MTRPPQSTEPPDFAERPRDLRRCDTGEISVDDLRRETKRRAERRPKEIAAAIAIIIAALGTAIAGIVKAGSAHNRVDVNDYRLGQVEKKADDTADKVDACRLDIARCCAKE